MNSSLLCDGKILIVGDGDFSFTVSLMKHYSLVPDQVFTSNLESETSVLHHAQASQNMSTLKTIGVSVFLETDARDLHNHPQICKERFDRILFNFPLADRHNIKKNRALLADFFSSCKFVLAPMGRVLVTLCKGQGGTPADQPVRSWHDSWQIVAMACNAGLLLQEILPFNSADYPEYHSVGFRFQDKSFDVTGALTHVFEEGEMVKDSESCGRGVVVKDGETFSCSSYVASCMNRNLLDEPRNPLFILRQNVELKLSQSESVIHHGCSPIIPSHKSKAYQHDQEELEEYLNTSENGSAKISKDWKNCENLKIMQKNQLAHGVADKSPEESCQTLDEGDCIFSTFLPKRDENVFILVKTKGATSELCRGDVVTDSKETNVFSIPSPSVNSVDGDDGQTTVGEEVLIAMGQTGQVTGDHQAQSSSDNSSLVYHCRTSLLENVPYLCQTLKSSRGMDVQMNDSPPKHRTVTDSDSLHLEASYGDCMTCSSLQASQQRNAHFSDSLPLRSPRPSDALQYSEQNASNDGVDFYPRLVAFGQCMLPCPITPSSTPVKHQMLILHQVTENPESMHGANASHSRWHFEQEHLSNKIVSFLQSLFSPSSSHKISLLAESRLTKIHITGMDESQVVCQLILNSDKDTVTKSSHLFKNVGSIVYSKKGETYYHVTVVHLEHFVCNLCGIDDPRLLWCTNDKFLDQFHLELSLCQYRPFSLYPLKFVHDLSFWESDNESEPFDVNRFYEVIRNIAGDIVVNVCLVDVYEDPNTKRRSRCYRLYFLSGDKCLPYVTSWKLQSQIRVEVAKNIRVQLR